MPPVSKTRLLALRQCSLRLWLEAHRPELRADSADTQARFAAGHDVGEMARRLYDPHGRGTLVDLDRRDYAAAFAQTRSLLPARQPVFEAGFQAEGALAFADVLLPHGRGARAGWRMVEVKSSTQVHD